MKPMNALCIIVSVGCGGRTSSETPADPSRPNPIHQTAAGPTHPHREITPVPVVNLLRAVPTQVVVSSVASPGMSGPSRMVDGRMDTAWNSKTGELAGASVAVQLPAEVEEVTEIRLVPGFIRNYQGQDLWEANHRIRRVAVSRNGVEVTTHDFDVARREAQAIPVAGHGGGGLWRIEILTTEPGSRRDWQEVCVTELEVMGRVETTAASGPHTPAARVATLAGNANAPRVASERLTRRRTREWQPFEVYGPMDARLADGTPTDAEVDRLLQGDHVSRIRPLRLVELSSATDTDRDRVILALYYHDPVAEEATQERMARTPGWRRGGDEPCTEAEDEIPCPSVWLARVSIPNEGLPVVDAAEEIASDVCSSEVRFVVRELDADGRDELLVGVQWQTHPVCPIGQSSRGIERIVDIDSLRAQWVGDMLERSVECIPSMEASRRVRDANGDGHPDFVLRTRRTDPDCETGDVRERATTTEEQFLYDEATDAWVSGNPPPRPTP